MPFQDFAIFALQKLTIRQTQRCCSFVEMTADFLQIWAKMCRVTLSQRMFS